MPITPTYPGVYVEELPSGVHPITGVSTSITAFVGLAQIGPDNAATRILSFADYQRVFGGVVGYSQMSYAVNQFFLNGGTEAYVIRLIGQNTTADRAILYNKTTSALQVDALQKGDTGTVTELFVIPDTSGTTFTLAVVNTPKPQKGVQPNPASAIVETYQGLTMDKTDSVHYVVGHVNGSSKLIQVTDVANDKTKLPDASASSHGTLTSGALVDGDVTSLPDDGSGKNPRAMSMRIILNGTTPYTITPLPTNKGKNFADLADVAKGIQAAVIALSPSDPAYTGFTCTVSNGTLVLSSGTYGTFSSVKVLAATGDQLANLLKLEPGTGISENASGQKLSGASGGAFVSGEEYNLFIGDRSQRQGIYGLDGVDLFNILCLPGISDAGILDAADAYCKEKRAFMIIDPTSGLSPDAIYSQVTSGTAYPPSDHSAIYYPWILVADPLNNGTPAPFPPSGTIAGVYASTDASRGVWKAPAGVDATLVGAQGLEYMLTNAQNGVLNPVAVNCLRTFPTVGSVSWGSRTLRGADNSGSDYKYVPVRRTALFLEESLYRGLQWVVFEPNDEPLWAQIRLNVTAFMQDLFRKGAFQGSTPRQAYLVKCDSETTTQTDIDNGIVNILVGFAPLKPAEFVILQIEQLAGQTQS